MNEIETKPDAPVTPQPRAAARPRWVRWFGPLDPAPAPAGHPPEFDPAWVHPIVALR